MSQATNFFMEKHQDLRNFILELKYGVAHDNTANHIAQQIPFRLNKSSKYVNGIDLTLATQNK